MAKDREAIKILSKKIAMTINGGMSRGLLRCEASVNSLTNTPGIVFIRKSNNKILYVFSLSAAEDHKTGELKAVTNIGVKSDNGGGEKNG